MRANSPLRSLVPAAAALVTLLGGRAASAQYCIPGTPFCAGKDGVTVTGPAPNVGGQVGGNAGGSAGGTVQGQGQATLPNVTVRPPDYTAAWSAYLQWRADMQARVKVRVEAQVKGELEAEARVRIPDPYLHLPPPVRYEGGGGGGGGATSSGRGFGFSFIGLVTGVVSGRRSPMYFGPPLHLRAPITDDLRFATDLAWLWLLYDDTSRDPTTGKTGTSTTGALQVRPGVVFELVRGRRERDAHMYARAGAHVTVPTGGGAIVPSAFVGPSSGLGVSGSAGGFQLGLEWNLDGWYALGTARDRSFEGFRVGTDARAWIGFYL